VRTDRLLGHELNRIPKADQKADPKRRRSLTEEELKGLLAVATTRPLTDARTVRRDKRKGEAFAELKPETVARLGAVGHERALIYKTLVLTGLRKNEQATLTIGQLAPPQQLVPPVGRCRREEPRGERGRHPRRPRRRPAPLAV
jgi:hypothetical protein